MKSYRYCNINEWKNLLRYLDWNTLHKRTGDVTVGSRSYSFILKVFDTWKKETALVKWCFWHMAKAEWYLWILLSRAIARLKCTWKKETALVKWWFRSIGATLCRHATTSRCCKNFDFYATVNFKFLKTIGASKSWNYHICLFYKYLCWIWIPVHLIIKLKYKKFTKKYVKTHTH